MRDDIIAFQKQYICTAMILGLKWSNNKCVYLFRLSTIRH